MSWNEFALELAKRQHDLETLYSDIDIPDHEKTTQYSELFGHVLGMMNDQVRQLQDLKDRLNEEVETFQTEIQNLTLWLGQEDNSVEQLSKKLEGLSLYSKHRLLREERDSRFELYAQKLETIRGLHRQLHDFSIQLGSSFVDPGPYPEEGALVTFDVTQTFTYNIEECQREKGRRIEQIKQLIVAIKHLWGELGWTPQDAFDRNVIEKGDDGNYSLLEETIARLELKQTMLEDERKKRETHVQELRNEIKALWEKLRVEDDEQERFFENHLGLSVVTVNAHKKELARLHNLKKLRLEEFIAEERYKIGELWDQLYYSTEQREAFEPMFTEDLTDELLELHEQEVSRLAQEAEEVRPILVAVERYERMVEEVRAFEVSTQDSTRLLKAEPGLLLREEKTRRRLQREQPVLEQELQRLLLQFQEEQGRPFLVYGEEYIVTMKSHMAEAREGRDIEQRRELRLAGDLRYGAQNPKNPKATYHSFVRSISPPLLMDSTAPQTPTHSRTYNVLASSPHPTTPSRSKVWMMSPRTPRAHAAGGSGTLTAVPQSPASKMTQYLLQTPSGQMHKRLGGGGDNGSKTNLVSRSESPAVQRTMMMPSSMTSTTPKRSVSVAVLEGGGAGQLPGSLSSSAWTPTRSQSIISVASMDLNDVVEEDNDEEYQPSTPTRTRTPRPVALELMATNGVELEVTRGGGGAGVGGGGVKASTTMARLRAMAETNKRIPKRTAAELSSSSTSTSSSLSSSSSSLQPTNGSRSPSPSRQHHGHPQHPHSQVHRRPQHHDANPFFTSESVQRLGAGGMVQNVEQIEVEEEEEEGDVMIDGVSMTGGNRSSSNSSGSSSRSDTMPAGSTNQKHSHHQQRLRGGRSKSQPIEVDRDGEDDGWETEEEDDRMALEPDEHAKAKRRRQDTDAPMGPPSSKPRGAGGNVSGSSGASTGSRLDAMIIHD
ncbi:hypothetical protein DFQ27_000844 [Actinomortierella ambigua]|uniref:Microtubule associated protein n=1 Tax=Actinomortierella ambigua TaxID=1343610 RepID=A0A9P6QE17_9FUNG|nr:hypothetical protein DFQ27_000844 [Actinomortierella ambigua]